MITSATRDPLGIRSAALEYGAEPEVEHPRAAQPR